jgi:hypothetical protein
MIATKVKTKDETKKVLAKAKQGNFKSLGHAGAAIRLTAKRSIRKRKKVEKQKGLVVIGPDHSKVGASGSAHEHGGRYKRQRYPKRPFMGPSLEKTQDRLPKLWAGSVKA